MTDKLSINPEEHNEFVNSSGKPDWDAMYSVLDEVEGEKPKIKEVLVHQLPWPVVDAGFTQNTEDMTTFDEVIPPNRQGTFTLIQFYKGQEWSVPAEVLPPVSWQANSLRKLADIMESGKWLYEPPEEIIQAEVFEWLENNNTLLARLGENGRDPIPKSLFWMIRAVEASQQHQLANEHIRAGLIDLAFTAKINLTPGRIGPADISGDIDETGKLTAFVKDDMVGRMIGSKGAKIREMKRLYGYEIDIHSLG